MEANKVNWKSIERLRMIFFSSVIVSIMSILYFLPRITIPLGISYLFFLILRPLIPWLRKLGVKEGWASLLVVLVSLFVVIYPIVKIAPVIGSEADRFEYYVPKIEVYLRTNYEVIQVEVKERTGFDIGDKLLIGVLTSAKNGAQALLLNLPKLLGSVVEWFFIIPLFLYFFLKDGRGIRDGLLKIVPNSIFEKYYNLTYQFNRKLGDYIFAKFIEATIIGTLITVGLLAFDVRFSIILGLIAALTNIIPYAGPVIGAIPGIIFGLVEYGAGSPTFGALVAVYMIANVIDLALVFPILVSKLVDLHPAVVVISVILGSQFMGMGGMIISIPVAAAFKLILSEVYKELFVAGRRL